MLAAQRITLIKEILLDKKTVDTSTLSNYLGVSEVTIRKYFDQLEKEGFLKKVHGGAILNSAEEEESTEAEAFSERQLDIALAASDLISDGDSIFLGSGKICLALAAHLHTNKNLSVVTTNVSAVPHLLKVTPNVYLPGGNIAFDADQLMYAYGSGCLRQLSNVYVNKAFFSVDAIDLHAGITTNTLSDIDLLKVIPQISTQSIVLADSCRFDKIALHRFGTLQSFCVYITDNQIPDAYKNYFYSNDIKLISAYNI